MPRLGVSLAQLEGGLGALVGVRRGHPDVDHGDVRLLARRPGRGAPRRPPPCRAPRRRPRSAGSPARRGAAPSRRRSRPAREHRLDRGAGRPEATESSPCAVSTRSRSPRSPGPSGLAPPRPSSRTLSRRSPLCRATSTSMALAPACFWAFTTASPITDQAVNSRARSRRPTGALTRTRHRGEPGHVVQRGGQAAVLERGRVQPVGERPELADRGPGGVGAVGQRAAASAPGRR